MCNVSLAGLPAWNKFPGNSEKVHLQECDTEIEVLRGHWGIVANCRKCEILEEMPVKEGRRKDWKKVTFSLKKAVLWHSMQTSHGHSSFLIAEQFRKIPGREQGLPLAHTIKLCLSPQENPRMLEIKHFMFFSLKKKAKIRFFYRQGVMTYLFWTCRWKQRGICQEKSFSSDPFSQTSKGNPAGAWIFSLFHLPSPPAFSRLLHLLCPTVSPGHELLHCCSFHLQILSCTEELTAKLS